jgi:hypothetical protein
VLRLELEEGDRNMKSVDWIVLMAVIVLFVGSSPAQAESESTPETKVADKFKVSWSSIIYDKRISLRNAAASGDREQQVSETLSLCYEVESLDPNLVLGICIEPMIEEVTDGEGANIEFVPVSFKSNDMNYEALHYSRRYVRPPKPAWWKTAIRSVLRLPPKAKTRGRWVNKLEPNRMRIGLDVGLSKRSSGEIGRVKGHFYALVAESLEYVELPFKQSDDWVRLTPNMEIRLQDAQCTERKFRFSTNRRPAGGASMRTLSVHDYLPSRILVARILIGEDGKPISHQFGIQRLPAHLLEGTNGSGSDCLIKSIRFVIAVNPKHHKIPFVLKHIPLPKP